MSFTNARIEKAFNAYSPPTKVAVTVEAKSITYTDPHVCPYCQVPMRKTSIRKVNGDIEPVYLCSADRAVGVVPDLEISK